MPTRLRVMTPDEIYRLAGGDNGNSSTSGVNQMFQGLQALEKQKEQQLKTGTPSTPDSVSSTKPILAELRGYQPMAQTVPMAPTSGVAGVNDMVSGAPAPTQQTVWVKHGKAGSVGTDEFELRQRMLPYVKQDYDNPESNNDNIRKFLQEPDRGKALKYVEFAPKNRKAPVVVDDGMEALVKGTALEGHVTSGMKFTKDEWKRVQDLAQYAFKSNREGRLTDTVELGNQLKEMSLLLQKKKLEKAEGDAQVDNIMKQLSAGFGLTDKPKPSTTTTVTKPPSFKSADEVEAALNKGDIKVGQIVNVGGKNFKVGK